MPRLPLPDDADLSPRQKEVVEMVRSGPRGGVRGPFGAWIRSPEFAAIAQELGAHVRFRSCLNDRVREVVICATAASIRAQYEWFAHARIAREAGVSDATLEAIRTDKRPGEMPAETPEDEAMAYAFVDELLQTKRVSDKRYAAAVEMFGEEGVIEHIKSIGLYRNKAKNVSKLGRFLVEEYGGEVPSSRAALSSLPGVGRKTANVVLNMWWGHPAQAVDTHIFRIGNRTGICPGKDVNAVERAIEDNVPAEFQRHAHH